MQVFHPFGSSVDKFCLELRLRRICPLDIFVTLQEHVLRVAVWRKAHPTFVSRTRKLRIHTAGVCVISRSVAKGSSAFRSRADNTWGAGPWEGRLSPGNKQETISKNEVVSFQMNVNKSRIFFFKVIKSSSSGQRG